MTDPIQLTPVLEAKLKNVSAAIVNKPPLCSGTWEIPTESFQLCFRNADNSTEYVQIPFPVISSHVNHRWLDLLKGTETQLESLSKACASATFGADNKNVMDLSYRKAGKMDATESLTLCHASILNT